MIERQIDQGLVSCVDKSVTLGDLLKRYLKEVTPHKKSHDKETCRIKALLKRPISGVGLPNLTYTIISNFKTLRLVDGARTTRYDLALTGIALSLHDWSGGITYLLTQLIW